MYNPALSSLGAGENRERLGSMLYHVSAPLEGRFQSLEEVQLHIAIPPIFKPRIPFSRLPGEDNKTPRICLAPSLEDCITGMGVNLFHRCINDNCFAVDGREVYPILVSSFWTEDLDLYKPSSEEVPDVEETREIWALNQAIPAYVDLIWLGMDSVFVPWENEHICEYVRFFKEPPEWGNHPWLNGKGHNLDSLGRELSEKEGY